MMVMNFQRIGLMLLWGAICSTVLFPHTFSTIPRHDYLFILIAAVLFAVPLILTVWLDSQLIMSQLGLYIFFLLALTIPNIGRLESIIWLPVIKEYGPLIIGSMLIAYTAANGLINRRHVTWFMVCCFATVLLAFLQQMTAQNLLIEWFYGGAPIYDEHIARSSGDHIGFGFGLTVESLMYPAAALSIFTITVLVFSNEKRWWIRSLCWLAYTLAIFDILVVGVRTAWLALPLSLVCLALLFRRDIVSKSSMVMSFMILPVVYFLVCTLIFQSSILASGSTLVRGAQGRFFPLFIQDICQKTYINEPFILRAKCPLISKGTASERMRLGGVKEIWNSSSVQHRIGVQKQALNLWLEFPIWGVGINRIQDELRQRISDQGQIEHYQVTNGQTISFDPHSTILKILTEYGVVGFLFILTPFVFIIFQIRQLYRVQQLPVIMIGTTGMLFLLLLLSMTRTLIYLNYLWWLFGFWWGTTYYTLKQSK